MGVSRLGAGWGEYGERAERFANKEEGGHEGDDGERLDDEAGVDERMHEEVRDSKHVRRVRHVPEHHRDPHLPANRIYGNCRKHDAHRAQGNKGTHGVDGAHTRHHDCFGGRVIHRHWYLLRLS